MERILSELRFWRREASRRKDRLEDALFAKASGLMELGFKVVDLRLNSGLCTVFSSDDHGGLYRVQTYNGFPGDDQQIFDIVSFDWQNLVKGRLLLNRKGDFLSVVDCSNQPKLMRNWRSLAKSFLKSQFNEGLTQEAFGQELQACSEEIVNNEVRVVKVSCPTKTDPEVASDALLRIIK